MPLAEWRSYTSSPTSFLYTTLTSWATNTSFTRYQVWPCPPGHYCQRGLRYPCPPGTYGGLPQEIRSTCQGLCQAGYYCPEASISPRSVPCGSPYLICPPGQALPQRLPAGWYSLPENVSELFRFDQALCPPGYYCPGDGFKVPCPPGVYAQGLGSSSPECEGQCERGR